MIRKAVLSDLDSCAEIYREHFRHERETVPWTNWREGVYPTRETARRALDAGTLYVDEEDGTVVSCASLNHVQPAEYAKISWKYPARGDEVLVIHTLVCRPGCTRGGRGSRFVAFAEELGRAQGCRVLRLDTYEGNAPARNFYTKLGYRLAGQTGFFFEGFIRETLVCFEKPLF